MYIFLSPCNVGLISFEFGFNTSDLFETNNFVLLPKLSGLCILFIISKYFFSSSLTLPFISEVFGELDIFKC